MARGYTATRLDDIARAAGVTRQLLQRHFPTKSALYLSLLDRHHERMLAIIARTWQASDDDHAAVRTAVRAWFDYLEQHPFVAAFLFDDATGDPSNAERHAQMRNDARGALQYALAAALPAGTPAAEIEVLAEMVRSSAVGLARWDGSNNPLTTDQVADLAVDTWLAVLRR